jgi:hypothetical protein
MFLGVVVAVLLVICIWWRAGRQRRQQQAEREAVLRAWDQQRTQQQQREQQQQLVVGTVVGMRDAAGRGGAQVANQTRGSNQLDAITVRQTLTTAQLETFRKNGDEDCAICLVAYEVGDELRRLRCSHVSCLCLTHAALRDSR